MKAMIAFATPITRKNTGEDYLLSLNLQNVLQPNVLAILGYECPNCFIGGCFWKLYFFPSKHQEVNTLK